jgi:hypothetical protein
MNQPEDVEVILSHKHKYRFHSGVLARHSSLLAEMLTERCAAQLSNKAIRAGIKIRWRIALTRIPSNAMPAGKLELVQLDSMGEPLDYHNGLVVNENGRVPLKVFDHYEAVFYAFYAKDLTIADDDMSVALIEAIDIIDVAEYLGCMPVISKPIEVTLLKHGQTLFRAIQASPWGWVDMACRIKSEVIFKEAVIHLSGNWRKIKSDREAIKRLRDCPEMVIQLCEQQHRALIVKGKGLELALASLYPGGMAVPSEHLPIRREEYAKDVLVWMALTFFRHWLSQRIISEKGSAAPDGGFELYSQIGQAGEAYMDKHVVNQFHTKFPMTKKAIHVLENHLLEIKECMKGLVESHGILASTCQLDIHRYPVDYITCAQLEKGDYPWVGEGVVGEGAGNTRRLGGNEIVQRNREISRRFAEVEANRARQQEYREDDEEEEEQEGGDGERRAKRGRYE